MDEEDLSKPLGECPPTIHVNYSTNDLCTDPQSSLKSATMSSIENGIVETDNQESNADYLHEILNSGEFSNSLQPTVSENYQRGIQFPDELNVCESINCHLNPRDCLSSSIDHSQSTRNSCASDTVTPCDMPSPCSFRPEETNISLPVQLFPDGEFYKYESLIAGENGVEASKDVNILTVFDKSRPVDEYLEVDSFERLKNLPEERIETDVVDKVIHYNSNNTNTYQQCQEIDERAKILPSIQHNTAQLELGSPCQEETSLETMSTDLRNKDGFSKSKFKFPFWKKSSDNGEVYKADTPTIVAFCEDKTDGESPDASGVCSVSAQNPGSNTCFEVLKPVETRSEDTSPNNVQDEMLQIIKELRRLSADCDFSILKSNSNNQLFETGEEEICTNGSKFSNSREETVINRNDIFDPLSPIEEDSSSMVTPEDEDTNANHAKTFPINVFKLWRNRDIAKISTTAVNNGGGNSSDDKNIDGNTGKKYTLIKRNIIAPETPVTNIGLNHDKLGAELKPRLKKVSFSFDENGESLVIDETKSPNKNNEPVVTNETILISKLRRTASLEKPAGQNITQSNASCQRKPRTSSLPVEYEISYLDSNAIQLQQNNVQDILPDPEEVNSEVRNSKYNLVCDETEGFEGVTNRGFIVDSPYLTKNLAVQEPGDISTSSDDEEDQTSDYDNKDLPSSSERGSLQVIKRPDRRITLPRPYSASFVEDLISYNRKENLPKAWHSLKINFVERSLLTDRPKVAMSTRETEMRASIQYEDESLEDLPSPENNGKRPVAEEDSLSLEFFVPGKKKYIRLHRRTFIHFLLKYSIFLLTFLFWVASLSGIGFGTWMLLSNGAIIDDVTDVFLDPYVLMCVVSGIIFLVTFFGCVGALRENVLLLNLFRFSMTAVLVLEGLLSTLVFLFYTMPEFRRAVKVGPEEVLKKAVKQYFDDEGMKKWIDTVQKEFKCCGVSMSDDGYLDWQENQYYNCSASNPSVYRCSVPLSCCIFEPGEYINYRCGADIMNREELYVNHMINTKGCMKSFGEWLGKNDVVIGYVALGVIIPQILGVIAARYFVKHLSKHTTWRQLSDPVQIVSPT